MVVADTNSAIHDSQILSLNLATNAPLTPGSYGITTSSTATVGAVVVYSAFNATCVDINDEQASSGTITIATVTSVEITGTFDLILNSSDADGGSSPGTDHVTGSFSAPICPAFGTALSQMNENNDGGPEGCN